VDVKPYHTDATLCKIAHMCPTLNGIDVWDVGINQVDMPSSISQVSTNIHPSQVTDKMLH